MILTILAATTAPLAAFDNTRFLDAIMQVEGHAWSDAGGAYAIMPATWRDHSKRPYSFASQPVYARDVADRHIAWLSRTLRTHDYPVNAYTLACCWRFGFVGFVQRTKQGGGAMQYGERVWNLYNDSSNKKP
jgi:hypothetical protein